MNIGVDFHYYDDSSQGIKTLLLGLYKEVIKQNNKHKIFIFVGDPEKLIKENNFFLNERVSLIKIGKMGKVFRLLFFFPFAKLKYKIDLFHFQFIAAPLIVKSSFIHIHDVLYEDFPEFFTKFFVFRSKILIRLSAIFSRHIFTISQYSSEKICKHYGVSNKKISCNYPGVDKEKFSFPMGENTKDILKKYNLNSKEYYFIHGRLDPRKNHKIILKALKKLKNQIPLAIAGNGPTLNELKNYSKELNITDRVKFLGELPQQDLAILLSQCRVFIFPSICEGFGLPVLEAQQCSVPTITSNSTSMKELFSNSSILINPTKENELVDAILLLENSENKQQMIIDKGSKNTKRFSYQESAIKLLETIESI